MNEPSATKNRIIQWLLVAIIVAGAVAVLLVVLKVTGIVIPQFIVTIVWIVVAVVLGAAALKLIGSMFFER